MGETYTSRASRFNGRISQWQAAASISLDKWTGSPLPPLFNVESTRAAWTSIRLSKRPTCFERPLIICNDNEAHPTASLGRSPPRSINNRFPLHFKQESAAFARLFNVATNGVLQKYRLEMGRRTATASDCIQRE